MTVDKSRTLQTLEGRSLEPDGEQNVALTMWTTLFVDDRHVGFGGPRDLDSWFSVYRWIHLFGWFGKSPGFSPARLFSPNEDFLIHVQRICQAIFARFRNFLVAVP